jgi:hypothetical protein
VYSGVDVTVGNGVFVGVGVAAGAPAPQAAAASAISIARLAGMIRLRANMLYSSDI